MKVRIGAAKPVLRVKMYPDLDAALQVEGGISTLVRAYAKHASIANLEFVDSVDDADVVAVHAGVQTMIRSKPLVAHCHGLYWTGDDNTLGEGHFESNAAVIQSLREADVVTVPSRWVAEPLRRDMHLDPEILPHAIDASMTKTAHNGGYVLWNKTRIGDACNVDALKALATAYPATQFKTTLYEGMRKRNVSVIGVLPHEQMLETVAAADVYLSTAKETFGIGTLEALAAGVPVLGWAEGGNLDLVEHGITGYLAKPGDYKDLSFGFAFIRQRRDEMSEHCRAAASKYTWPVIMRRLRAIYEQAIAVHSHFATRAVTVVIPCYNKAETLGRAIDSALDQTQPPAAVIVVDNNSTDNSAQVANSYGKRVHYTNCSEQGVAHARNSGIALATTPYVCCLDADDSIAPSFLETCVSTLADNPALGASYTGLTAHDAEGNMQVSAWPGEYDFDAFLQRKNQVPTCCVFRRDVWARLGGYRQRYAPRGAGAEDAEFWLRMGAYGYPAKKATAEGLFHYRLHGGATSNPEYREMDWTWWHPWTRDGRHPFASAATPHLFSHLVHAYDKPKVSVVIPCTPHHLPLLRDALDSVEAQGLREWEAIVVLDFDGHEDEVLAMHTAYPFVTFLRNKGRHGAGRARNVGAARARGQFLLFLDADDFMHPTALERLVGEADEYGEPVVVYSDYTGHAFIETGLAEQMRRAGRLLSYDPHDSYAHISYEAFEYDCERAQRQPDAKSKDEPYLWCLVSSLVPRRLHDEIGGFDEEMESWEDWDYWLRLARKGICFTRVRERLIDYRFFSGTRRESGRQLAGDLLQYITRKYSEEAPMPCGRCGRRSPQWIAEQQKQAAIPRPVAIPQLKGQAVNEKDLIMVRLIDGNIGQHPIYGGVTRFNYGYRAHGDEFLMYIDDYKSRRDNFEIVEGSSGTPPVPPPVEKPVETPVEKPVEVKTKPVEAKAKPAGRVIDEIPGVSPQAIDELRKAGFATFEAVLEAGADALIDLPYIGTATASRILNYARTAVKVRK